MPPKKTTTASGGAGKPSFQVGVGSDGSDEDKAAQAQATISAAAAAAAAEQAKAAQAPAKRAAQSAAAKLPTFTRLTSEKRRGKRGAAGHEADAEEDDDEEEEDEELRWERYKSGPTTPNIAEAAQQLRRSLSVSGLAHLANGGPDGGGGIKRKLWRPADEEAREPGDWERLAVHVLRGGFRAGIVAFGLRGSVMLVFALLKILRTRKFKGKELLLCYFGAANGRFTAMFALWALLYKLVHNSLRLVTPPPIGKQRRNTYPIGDEPELSGPGSGVNTPRAFSTHTDEEKHKIKNKQRRKAFMRDPRSKVWHAYVAGAISALAVLVETDDMKISLAQQLFVRGLEGSYNLAHARGRINVPYGSVLVFGLACGQIMYAWVNVPESLPRGYVSWIAKASKATPLSTTLHRSIKTTGKFDPDVLLKYFPDGKIPEPISTAPLRYPNVPVNNINMRGITGKNVAVFADMMDRYKRGEKLEFLPCAVLHPWENSHFWSPIDRFVTVVRFILPVYMTLYFVPAVFLRTKSFLKAPLRIMLRSLFGSIRSSSFLGVFVIIFQILFCSYQQIFEGLESSPTFKAILPEKIRKLALHQSLIWFAGFSTCLSLFVDDARRRAELAAYVLPKGMESAWSIARQRSWVPFVPGGDLLLTSVGMSLVMGTYAQHPEHLSGLVRRVIYQFVGRN